MLKPFGHEIWIADGQQASVAGFNYPTRMAVIRLPEDRLFLWSPVTLSEELRGAVDGLGEVRYLVAPNSLHHLFLQPWKAAYPQAALYAAPGLRQKRPDIHFDADLEDAPNEEWAQQLDQVHVHGNLITTEVVFFHRASGTVLFTDLLQQFQPGWFRGWRAAVARLDLMTGSQAQVPRKFRAAFADRQRARGSLARIQTWPAEKVVMAHGAPIPQDGAVFIRHAFPLAFQVGPPSILPCTSELPHRGDRAGCSLSLARRQNPTLDGRPQQDSQALGGGSIGTPMSVCGRPFGCKGFSERFSATGSGASVCPAC